MSFIWPVMFILLLLIPLCAVLYIRMQRRRQRLAAVSFTSGRACQDDFDRHGCKRH